MQTGFMSIIRYKNKFGNMNKRQPFFFFGKFIENLFVDQ